MGNTLRRVLFAAVVTITAAFAFGDAIAATTRTDARSNLTLLAPAAPGGGWDGFSRTAQQTLRSEGIVPNVQVVNVPGAAGTIGLAQVVRMEGRSDLLMATGGVMIGGISISKPKESLADVTLIARVADTYTALVVPASSGIATLDEFVAAWRADPSGTTFAGGSLGSTDHLVAGLLAREVGIDPVDLTYLPYAGDAISALLAGTTTAGISGYHEVAGQIAAGQLRLLAISAPEPVDGIDAVTLVEAGYDVRLTNWRGFAAPPGITAEDARALLDVLTRMHGTTAWREALERSAWTDTWATGADFAEFVRAEQRTADAIVRELGL